MASVLNKRQQARNERTLQELIKTVPGNSVCADCGARNPGWASWSVGVFLCMRCAAIHRKLGTHISKVKSLSMDKWDNAQVDNMKRVGNVESNKLYNPRNVKPQIPIDVDEVDSAMERFVRQKYEQRVFMNDSRPGTRSNTGSSSSVEDRPPPLPPKPTKRFGFGIQKSNTFPGHVTPPSSPGRGVFNGYDQSPPMVNKPSRVFGSNVNTSGDGLDSKLATLRDMGFHDEKRNSAVLKSLNGNLDKAVEALIRLGETTKSRASTPTPPAKGPNGLSFERTQTAPAASMNPFEALDAMPQQQHPQPQTQLNPYGGAMTQPTSPANSYNPFFGMQNNQQNYPQQQQQQQQFAQHSNPFGVPQGLEQSFQGLQLSNQQPQQLQQPQQPLFPNRTGGYGQVSAPLVQSNPFAQSFTPPPMAQAAQQYGSNYQLQTQLQNQQQPPLSTPTSPGNPFLKSTRSQMFTQATMPSANPFGLPLQQQQQPQQIQQQGQNPFLMQQQQFSQTHSPLVQAPNPFDTQQQQQQPYQQSYPQQSQQNPYQQSYQQPQQAPNYQQTQNQNQKNSILALYNYPQLAPQRPEQLQTPPPAAQQTATSPPQVQSTGQLNPFAAATQAPLQQQQVASAIPPQVQNGTRHVSNESVDFAGLMGGRQSPDAFSGLSSSFRR